MLKADHARAECIYSDLLFDSAFRRTVNDTESNIAKPGLGNSRLPSFLSTILSAEVMKRFLGGMSSPSQDLLPKSGCPIPLLVRTIYKYGSSISSKHLVRCWAFASLQSPGILILL